MTSSFLDDLGRALDQAGIPRRRCARIVAEFADHLQERPDADLGEPGPLAAQFANDLGFRIARRTAFNTSLCILLLLVPLSLTLTLPAATLPGVRQIGSGHWPTFSIVTTILFLIDALFTLAAGAIVLTRTRAHNTSHTTFKRWSRASYWSAWFATLGLVFVYETPPTLVFMRLALLASAALLAWCAPSAHTFARIAKRSSPRHRPPTG